MTNNESIKDTLEVIRRALEDENAFSQNNENVLILNKKVNDDGTVKLLDQPKKRLLKMLSYHYSFACFK